jgi:SAM-dependent methyltransferase
MQCPPLPPNRSQQISDGNADLSRAAQCGFLGASLRNEGLSSGLPYWSSVAVPGKPDAVKGARPVWSRGKTARSTNHYPRVGPMEQTSHHIRACYDAVAREYAERFAGELDHKPLDRELLSRFASKVSGRGEIYDLGCGPGQTTAFLHGRGASVRGLDLSAELLREARQRHPGLKFESGDMLALPLADASLAGVVAFYAIVHLSPAGLRRALEEMHRVLRHGGRLLLAFHIGEGSIHVDEFLGRSVALDFVFFTPQVVTGELVRAGFAAVEVIERDPYPEVEYPSRRAYLFARKAECNGEALGPAEPGAAADRPRD